MNKKVKAILFDLDDTLVRTSEVRYETFKEIGRKYNLVLTDLDITKAWSLPMIPFMKALYGEVDSYENLMEHYEVIKDSYPNQPELHAVETIEQLSKHAVLGVVSSASNIWIKHDLTSVGFSLDHFTYILGAEDSDHHKPHPHVFLPIINELEKVAISKDEIIYVGDLLNDYHAAKGAGISFYALADRTTAKSDFVKSGAETIDTLSELLQLIK